MTTSSNEKPSRAMNPSRHQLPQKVSDDRRRGRDDTRRIEQERFQLDREGPSKDSDLARLPPFAKGLPREVKFLHSYKTRLGMAKLERMVKSKVVSALTLFRRFDKQDDYHALYRLLGGDAESLGRWRLDAEFGRMRLDGVNPMAIQKLRDDSSTPLWEAAARVLGPKMDIRSLFRQEKLYFVEYADLWHATVQDEVRKARPRRGRPVRLAAPTCLFWEKDGQLLPLSIQLKPADVAEPNPVITPLDKPADWQMARAHVSAADGHVHEGYYHLLETHLVNEAVALCMYRQLHPDHPVRQLLTPHYHGTLAINDTARKHLLCIRPSGPIQTAMAAGVTGTLNAARLRYRRWSFTERALERDIEVRGVEHLPNYHYRDDALKIHAALKRFVHAFLSLWYHGAADVAEDYELQDFLTEVGAPLGGDVPGFPARLASPAELVELVTHLIFRAGPQHAAVNNGQFDTYGEAANGPGRLHGELPEEIRQDQAHYQEVDFWRGLPGREAAVAQMCMVWVLSLPTQRSILHTGEFPDFDPALSFEAVEAIAALRRRLQSISCDIQERNTKLAIPYRYLDPQNVSRSTDV
jgi:hypothetical protein